MSDLSDLIRPDAVFTGVSVGNRKALIERTAAALATQTGGDARLIAERLGEREKLGSTGFGGGVAIPHARVDGLSGVVAVFLRLQQPIDFGAVDAVPVDLVWAQLSAPQAGDEHLKALARVSRRLRDRAFLAKLRGAGSPDALYALFSQGAALDAA